MLIYLEIDKNNLDTRIQKILQTAEQTLPETRNPDGNLKRDEKMNENDEVSTIGEPFSEENRDNSPIHDVHPKRKTVADVYEKPN